MTVLMTRIIHEVQVHKPKQRLFLFYIANERAGSGVLIRIVVIKVDSGFFKEAAEPFPLVGRADLGLGIVLPDLAEDSGEQAFLALYNGRQSILCAAPVVVDDAML